jgi:hypothetical protein
VVVAITKKDEVVVLLLVMPKMCHEFWAFGSFARQPSKFVSKGVPSCEDELGAPPEIVGMAFPGNGKPTHGDSVY